MSRKEGEDGENDGLFSSQGKFLKGEIDAKERRVNEGQEELQRSQGGARNLSGLTSATYDKNSESY